MSKIHLSLVIPAYNEEKIVKDTLDTIISFLRKKKYSWEVVVVDDGSNDDTVKEVQCVRNKAVRLCKL